jgi:hypothetical protein
MQKGCGRKATPDDNLVQGQEFEQEEQIGSDADKIAMKRIRMEIPACASHPFQLSIRCLVAP